MNREVKAAFRRIQESAKAIKTTPNKVSDPDPTEASHVDNILDSCSIGLSTLATAEASLQSSNKTKSPEEACKHYRDDSPTLIVDDGFSWRKYGQKIISNSPHKRSYYRCHYKKHSNCEAKKQVQKIQDDPPMFRTSYFGEHTCKNVVVSVPVENANMIQFDSHDEAITTDRQKTSSSFLGVDFPALTEEEMKFLDDFFVSEHTCKNVVVSVPVENANMSQFDSHDEAITTDRQKTVNRAANQEEEQDKYEQWFLGVDFSALTEEDMKFFDDC